MTPREQWQLDTRRIGRRVLVFDRLDSTSNCVAQYAMDSTQDGLAILADEQTAGRGQYGRSWLAQPRSSVLLSLLVFPPSSLQHPAVFTAWAAVSVCRLVHDLTSREPRIKWPNDVFLNRRKVCGILTECRTHAAPPSTSDARFSAVLGIGLNVQQSAADFAAAQLPEATSLAQHTCQPLETASVACSLLQRLDEEYHRLLQNERAPLESAWQHYLGLRNRPVWVECAASVQHGWLRELRFDNVLLERRDGSLLSLRPETIKHLYPEDENVGGTEAS